MQDVPIVIVGGGLSGLYAAFLLEQKGIAYRLLEARDTLGGRIAVAKSSGMTHAKPAVFDKKAADNDPSNKVSDNTESNNVFDLGPSWFWPDYQPQLSSLIESLNLSRFAQFEEGDMMVERAADQPPVRMQGYKSTPPSMRLVGGMAALIEALYARLDTRCIMTNQTVRQLTKTDGHIEVQSEDTSVLSPEYDYVSSAVCVTCATASVGRRSYNISTSATAKSEYTVARDSHLDGTPCQICGCL